jgi:hypothetical protein
MNAAHLRALAHSRFISLLMNRPKDDNRTHDTLRAQAAREIIREHRGQGSSGSVPSTANAGFELVFQKLWAICQRMAHYADQHGSLPTMHKLKTEPSIAAAPLVVDELNFSDNQNNSGQAVTLPVFSNGGGKQLIDESLYPSRYIDRTTEAWRRSILENQERAKQRDIASARHRSQQTAPRYVG